MPKRYSDEDVKALEDEVIALRKVVESLVANLGYMEQVAQTKLKTLGEMMRENMAIYVKSNMDAVMDTRRFEDRLRDVENTVWALKDKEQLPPMITPLQVLDALRQLPEHESHNLRYNSPALGALLREERLMIEGNVRFMIEQNNNLKNL